MHLVGDKSYSADSLLNENQAWHYLGIISDDDVLSLWASSLQARQLVTSVHFNLPCTMLITFVNCTILGGIFHPILVNKLINGSVGFHNAVRISASMNVSLLILAACLMRTRLPPKPKAQSFPVAQWFKEPAYVPLVLR